MTRTIGIRHRIKQTVQGEARPTQLAIIEDFGPARLLELADDDAELDFALGRYPASFRPIREDEAAADWPERHVQWKKLKKGETADDVPEHHQRRDGKIVFVARKVPEAYDGLVAGDTVAMTLGGSGDRFAYALSRRGDELDTDTRVLRITPADLKSRRGEADKADDALLLAQLVATEPALFRATTVRDRELIYLREAFDARMDAMKDRIACEQRLHQRHIGKVFCSPEGRFPEGSISAAYDALKANDVIYNALLSEEGKRDRELLKAVSQLDVYQELHALVTGLGPAICSRIIIAIGDIRTFQAPPDESRMQALYAESRQLEREGRFAEDRHQVADRLTPETPFYQQLQIVRSWKRANGQEQEAQLLDRAIACHEERHQLRHKAKRRGMAMLKHALGVHVQRGGKYADTQIEHEFPRHRAGQVGNWNGDGRQSLWLLADQFNRRPDTEWGKKLLHYKAHFRSRHPAPVKLPIGAQGAYRTIERLLLEKTGACPQPADGAVPDLPALEAWAMSCTSAAPQLTEEIWTHMTRARQKELKGVERKIIALYTNDHIHHMAIWRTATKFVEWLWKTWMALEERKAQTVPSQIGPDGSAPRNDGESEALGLDATAA